MIYLNPRSSVLSPLSWYGGKNLLKDFVLPYFPPHETYVEPFGGSGALLFAKRPALREVYNDLHPGLANLFKVIQNPEQAERLRYLLMLTPNARAEHAAYKKNDTCEDPVEWARRTFLLTRQSFSSIYGHTWGYSIRSKGNSFHNSIKLIAPASSRLRGVIIENRSAFDLFSVYDAATTLWLLDPPYVESARKSKNVYKYELAEDQQHQLVAAIQQLKGMVILCGYHNDIYGAAFGDWKTVEKTVYCYSSTSAGPLRGAGKPERTEVLWINPVAYDALCRSGRWPRTA